MSTVAPPTSISSSPIDPNSLPQSVQSFINGKGSKVRVNNEGNLEKIGTLLYIFEKLKYLLSCGIHADRTGTTLIKNTVINLSSKDNLNAKIIVELFNQALGSQAVRSSDVYKYAQRANYKEEVLKKELTLAFALATTENNGVEKAIADYFNSSIFKNTTDENKKQRLIAIMNEILIVDDAEMQKTLKTIEQNGALETPHRSALRTSKKLQNAGIMKDRAHPPTYTAPDVIKAQIKTGTDALLIPSLWADPEDIDLCGHPEFDPRARKNEKGELCDPRYGIPVKDRASLIPGGFTVDENGRPLNPKGDTGLKGRGELGKWGPNGAADPILLRKTKKGTLEALFIKRREGGQWGVPGGMVDPEDKNTSVTAKRELREEALNIPEENIEAFFNKLIPYVPTDLQDELKEPAKTPGLLRGKASEFKKIKESLQGELIPEFIQKMPIDDFYKLLRLHKTERAKALEAKGVKSEEIRQAQDIFDGYPSEKKEVIEFFIELEKLFERCVINPLFKTAKLVYEGYSDDERNTNNAWMETTAYCTIIDEKTQELFDLCAAGDDAQAKKYANPMKEDNLFASHKALCAMAILKMDASVASTAWSPEALTDHFVQKLQAKEYLAQSSVSAA